MMSDFSKAYKFVQGWLWDCREHGSTRRTTGGEWDNNYCADAADMIVDYNKKLQARVKELEAQNAIYKKHLIALVKEKYRDPLVVFAES